MRRVRRTAEASPRVTAGTGSIRKGGSLIINLSAVAPEAQLVTSPLPVSKFSDNRGGPVVRAPSRPALSAASTRAKSAHMHDPVAALAEIETRVAAAAREAGRAHPAATIVAVSKTFAAADISPLIAHGHRVFGENRVQEAQQKWPALKAATPDIELHLIGPLQSNKAEAAVALFDVIQTIDRPKIARAVADAMRRQQRPVRLFVQVNTGEEPQKAGIAPTETPAFLDYCRRELGLAPEGLMCIPPLDEMAAVHFAFLARLARASGVRALSMGMSADFETAVNLGATHVRVGSAIFGARD
jgi:hypothetical protein